MRKTFFLLALCLVFVSCSKRILVPTNYVPERGNINAVVRDGVVVYRLENLEVTGSHYVLSLEVINQSSEPVNIDVRNFRYYSSYEPFQKDYSPSNELNYPKRTFALNAEQVNQHFKEKIAAKQFLIGLAALTTAVAIIAIDAAKDEQDAKKRTWTEKDVRRSVNRDIKTDLALDLVQAGAEVMIYETGAKEREELHYLPEEYFTANTIKPKSRYHGKIYFRRNAGKYFRFILPQQQVRLIFDFEKVKKKEI